MTASPGETVVEEDIVLRANRHLAETPGGWMWIIAIGWWRLLLESSPSIRVDRVLEAGFSPLDWDICLHKSSWHLSLELADINRSPGETNMPNLEEFLKTVGCDDLINTVPSSSPRPECFDTCKGILRWAAVSPRFNPIAVKAIGYLWFLDFVSNHMSNVDATEVSEAALVDLALRSLESLLESDRTELLHLASQIEYLIPTEDLGWIPGFVTFPWGI